MAEEAYPSQDKTKKKKKEKKIGTGYVAKKAATGGEDALSTGAVEAIGKLEVTDGPQ